MNRPQSPIRLPKCEYPTAADFAKHGLLPLPDTLSVVNWREVEKYRSQKYTVLCLRKLSNEQILNMADLVAEAFSKNEPMKRHLQPPRVMPETIKNTTHIDPFGKEVFGEWSAGNIVYWFIRLLILTNPSDPLDNICKNTSSLDLSIAMFDDSLHWLGGAFNAVAHEESEVFRHSDPFLNAVLEADQPIIDLIFEQEHEAIEALKRKYTFFQKALKEEKVGLHFMVAKSPQLPTEYAFELVASSAEQFYQQGFEYMVVCASNQWTGAACEALNGTRVHFSPYRTKHRVAMTATAQPYVPHSEDGYISKKDSGAMFYVIKLNA